jgi:hypothetical protein
LRPIRVPANRAPFILGVANGILFTAGSALLDGGTVIAVFVQRLTQSSILVGLLVALGPLGWQAPQLWQARYLEARSHKLGTYRVGAGMRIGALIALTITSWLFVNRQPMLTLVCFVAFYATYCLGTGIGGVAFMDIVGRTVPGNYLGSFFGARQLGGGLLAAAGGLFLVKPLLRAYGFPLGYLILFALGTVIISIALLCFASVPEPPGPAREARRPLGEFLRRCLAAIREDRNLRRLLRVRYLMLAATIGMPFYVVFCVTALGAGEGMVGVYLAASTVGMFASNLIFAPMGDRLGHRRPIVIGAGCIAAATAAAVLVAFLPMAQRAAAFSFLPIVFLAAAGGAGMALGTNSYLLEHAPAADRPLYLGTVNTFTAPLAFTPVLGGVIVEAAGYRLAFLLSALASAFALFLATRLREIERDNRSA